MFKNALATREGSLGANITNIISAFHLTTQELNKDSHVLSEMKYFYKSNEMEKTKGEFLQELMLIRENILSAHGFNYNELNDIIDDVCIT